MSALYLKGGIPRHKSGTTKASSVLQAWPFSDGVANHLWFKNTGTGALTLYLNEQDAEAGNGITLASGAIWEGPAEIACFWTLSAAAESFEAVVFIRRG